MTEELEAKASLAKTEAIRVDTRSDIEKAYEKAKLNILASDSKEREEKALDKMVEAESRDA